MKLDERTVTILGHIALAWAVLSWPASLLGATWVFLWLRLAGPGVTRSLLPVEFMPAIQNVLVIAPPFIGIVGGIAVIAAARRARHSIALREGIAALVSGILLLLAASVAIAARSAL